MIKLYIIILLTISFNTFAQQQSLIGKWKPIEVNGGHFSINRNDSISLFDNYKRNKVSMQDNKAFIRSDYSKNIFVFTTDGDFEFYRNENPRSITFVGKYTLENSIIYLKVTNPANIELNKRAEYYFENGELHLKMHAEGNSPVFYVLNRIKN